MLFSDSVLKSAASLLLLAASAHAQCSEISGNYYCNKVDQVVYENIGFSGSYNKVTNFDTNSCSCSSKPVAFSGSLSPLDEEVSLHFRGPLNLKQFAYYSYNNTKSKRDVPEAETEKHTVARRHVHHAHKREIVYVTEYVQADAAAPSTAAAASTSTAAAAKKAAAAKASSSAASSSKQTTQTGTGWTRQSYYNAASRVVLLVPVSGTHALVTLFPTVVLTVFLVLALHKFLLILLSPLTRSFLFSLLRSVRVTPVDTTALAALLTMVSMATTRLLLLNSPCPLMLAPTLLLTVTCLLFGC